jgi:hypothetical protein
VDRPRFEYSTMSVQPGTIRITCRLAIARFLVDELRILAGKAEARNDADLLRHCAAGVSTILAEVEAQTATDARRSTGGTDPIRPTLN